MNTWTQLVELMTKYGVAPTLSTARQGGLYIPRLSPAPPSGVYWKIPRFSTVYAAIGTPIINPMQPMSFQGVTVNGQVTKSAQSHLSTFQQQLWNSLAPTYLNQSNTPLASALIGQNPQLVSTSTGL